MAQRTGFGAPLPLFPFAMLRSWPVSQAVKRKPVPARARRLRDRAAQRLVDSAIALEPAIRPNVDDDVLALVAANEWRAGQRQPGIERRLHARFGRAAVVGRLAQEVLGRPDAEIGVVRNLERALAGAFGEAAPRVRLDAPGDAPEQELLMIGSRLLAEHLPVLL